MQVVGLNVNGEGEGGSVVETEAGLELDLLGVTEECGAENKLIVLMIKLGVQTQNFLSASFWNQNFHRLETCRNISFFGLA